MKNSLFALVAIFVLSGCDKNDLSIHQEDRLTPEFEDRILQQLHSTDIVQLESTLIKIGDESINSPKIIQSLYIMLDDPRPERRLSRDVIGQSPSKHAYGALSKVTGFKPSQPSLLFEESKSELKDFLRIKYRYILQDDQRSDAPEAQKN